MFRVTMFWSDNIFILKNKLYYIAPIDSHQMLFPQNIKFIASFYNIFILGQKLARKL